MTNRFSFTIIFLHNLEDDTGAGVLRLFEFVLVFIVVDGPFVQLDTALKFNASSFDLRKIDC